MAKRLVTAAHSNGRADGTLCVSTRFGNVLGSNGSVLEIFKDLTLMDERITRSVMDIDEALGFLVETTDLARAAIRRWASLAGRHPESVRIRIVGARPGEKIHEALIPCGRPVDPLKGYRSGSVSPLGDDEIDALLARLDHVARVGG